MDRVSADIVEVSEAEQVVGWRAEKLLRAGYEDGAAFELALRPDVDLHLAVDLLKMGCSRETALRILS